MRKGLLSEEAFWSWAAGQVPKGYDAQLIRDEWWKGYALDPEILKLVKRLKGHYRLVAFSENVCSRIVYLDQRYHFRELFDEEIYSYDHHFGKCDPEFLDILLTTLGDRPDEILYIDNSKVPLEMAEKLGMKVIHYTTGQKKSIEAVMRCLGISSDAGPSLITT